MPQEQTGPQTMVTAQMSTIMLITSSLTSSFLWETSGREKVVDRKMASHIVGKNSMDRKRNNLVTLRVGPSRL